MMSVNPKTKAFLLVITVCLLLATQLVVCNSCSCNCSCLESEAEIRLQQQRAAYEMEKARLQSVLDNKKAEIAKLQDSQKTLEDEKNTAQTANNAAAAEKENWLKQINAATTEAVKTEGLTFTASEELKTTKEKIAAVQASIDEVAAKLKQYYY
jgi:hypothetical protein